jgi:ankyrin repeat protein
MPQITDRSFLATATVLTVLVVGCDRSPTAAQTSNATTKPTNAEPTLREQTARAGGDQRSDQQIRRDNALIAAIEQRQVAKAAELLTAGADASARYVDDEAFLSAGKTGYTALLHASWNGDVEAVKLLLAHKVDLNYRRKGKSALYLAAVQGHEEVAKLLKAAGADGDPDATRKTNNLIRAACKGFEMGPSEGYPPYPGAARDTENAPTILEVLKQGADVNSADPEGYTPLMYAANLGLVENVKTLLANGADPSRKSTRGDTAASMASGDSSVNRDERAQVVELLRQHSGGGR